MNFVSLLEEISCTYDADLFLYSGSIDEDYANIFLDNVHYQIDNNKRKNVCLFLCTYGGDPDSAYKIAKCLKRHYEKLSLFILGYCKSAGTLVALGADEIIMSNHGELGPLDVQMAKRDEIFFQSSGLDLLQAMDYLKKRSTDIFDHHFNYLIFKSSGAITIRTAADIASKMTNGLLSPIVAQIDPTRLGEMKRAINIAFDYGVRLNADKDVVHRLINGYPSHSFVIDFEEATDIFGNVRKLTELEEKFKLELTGLLNTKFGKDITKTPSDEIIVMNLSQILDKTNPKPEEKNEKQPKTEKLGNNRDTNGDQPFSKPERNNSAGASTKNASAKLV